MVWAANHSDPILNLMNRNEQIKKLIAEAKLTKAIAEFIDYCQQNGEDELYNNLILQSARNKANEDAQIQGIIPQTDYNREKARITHALLQYLDEFNGSSISSSHEVSNKPSNSNAPRTVFISYSTKNKDKANLVKEALEKAGFETIIDHDFFEIGKRFEDEILRAISTSDATLLLISKESLASPWVGMENVVGTIKQAVDQRPLFAAFLDKDFLGRRFAIDLTQKSINPQIKEIESLIDEQLKEGMGIENLQEDLSRLKALKNNLPQVISFLKERLTIDISDTGDGLQNQLNLLIDQLKSKLN